MINVDDRILDKVNEDEMWFILHIAKRVRNDKGLCFPSIATIAKDTGFGINKARKIKKQLAEKKVISIEERYNKSGRTSDNYKILSDYIGIMMGLNSIKSSPNENNEEHEDAHQNREGGTHQNREGGTHQNREGKLLTNEAINKLNKADHVKIFKRFYDSYKGSKRDLETEMRVLRSYYPKKEEDQIAEWKIILPKLYSGLQREMKEKERSKKEDQFKIQWKSMYKWLTMRCWETIYHEEQKPEINRMKPLDDFNLSKEMLETYKVWLTEGKNKYPALWKSDTKYLSKKNYFDLIQYFKKEETRIHFTKREFKNKIHECLNELNINKFLRDSQSNVYDFIMSKVKKQIKAA